MVGLKEYELASNVAEYREFRPFLSRIRSVHDVVDGYHPPEWVGEGRKSGGYN
jgi:hypothetical protein